MTPQQRAAAYRSALEKLLLATEDFQTSDPQMDSHQEVEAELDRRINAARKLLRMPPREEGR